jgi:hypothetical protein
VRKDDGDEEQRHAHAARVALLHAQDADLRAGARGPSARSGQAPHSDGPAAALMQTLG